MSIVDSPKFERLLEIIPGLSAWLFIFSPFVLAFVFPEVLAVFLLIYVFFYFVKSLNIARHIIFGYFRLKRNQRINWLERCQKTENIEKLHRELESRYKKEKSRFNWEDLLLVENLHEVQQNVKDWREIYHLVVFAVSTERLDIIEPALESIAKNNYDQKKMIVIMAGEANYKESFLADMAVMEKKFGKTFYDFRYYLHHEKEGEVRGKGSNISNAGHMFWAEYKNKGIAPENILVTNLDADHIVHKDYFGRLTYLYVLDPNRDHKTYQPIPLLFNNIWDVTLVNRIAATGSSFWQIVESMRPFRLRTFAAHSQSLSTLLVTDFWATHTIVEDGHQYWRTYFAFDGDHYMVPMFIPVYQDAVYSENYWTSFKNQYKQMRRWAWGVSDFPFVIINSIKHKEIPLPERLLQIWRQFAGNFGWSTFAFILAFGSLPLNFNKHFQDAVLAHKLSIYTSRMLMLAWGGVVIMVWVSLALFPPRPARWGRRRYIDMVTQWLIAPFISIITSAVPALEAQTRLMIGKKLEFWITPKKRIKEN
jgi:hypothetical protein